MLETDVQHRKDVEEGVRNILITTQQHLKQIHGFKLKAFVY